MYGLVGSEMCIRDRLNNCFKKMISAYINLDKEHASFLQVFKDVGIKKLGLKNIQNQSQIDIALTSLGKYGETKKNLSDIESASKPVPELIICDDESFDQTIDLSLIHI